MPKRKHPRSQSPGNSGPKLSYTQLEAQRDALMHRLERLDPRLKAKRGYASARALLGSSYRRADLAARLAVLETARFMINVLEMLPPF
jgi:hypothetical protein